MNVDTYLDIQTFLSNARNYCIIDVRSPDEFLAGHIPDAINIPLFSNTERAYLGTIYHKSGKNNAIDAGFNLLGSRLADLARQLRAANSSGKLFLYCWRGGMRSKSVAWLASQYGIDTYLLRGGYKSFRNWVLTSLDADFALVVLSGFTGTGKTMLLSKLADAQEPVIDLEKLANHKGSAFGNLENILQPSQEHFENLLAHSIRLLDPKKYFWIEDESRTIGKLTIPEGVWNSMRKAPIVQINSSLEERTRYLVECYGKISSESLQTAFQKIQKKLGPQAIQQAINAIQSQDLAQACQIALRYYDKTYATGLQNRENTRIEAVYPKNQPTEILLQELIKAKDVLIESTRLPF